MPTLNQTPEQIARDRIDEMLVEAGWIVQSKKQINLQAAKGVAVREYETEVGPADYILFINKKPVGLIEAKREEEGVRLTMHEYLAEVAKSHFEVVGVWNDRHNYYLTTKEWAERLDSNREEIERRWGKKLYRIFQLYRWGGGSAEGFYSGQIEAFRVVLKKME